MKNMKWTQDQIDFVINANKNERKTVKEIAAEMGRTVGSVSSMLVSKGIKLDKIPSIGVWSLSEDTILKAEWGNIPASKIAKKLGRTRSSVIARAHRISLPKFLYKQDKTAIKDKKKSEPSRPVSLSSDLYNLKTIRDFKSPAIIDDSNHLFQLKSNQCRYPLWADGETSGKYCGKIICDKGNTSYCEDCYNLCYRPSLTKNIKIPIERNVINSFHSKRKERRTMEERYRFNWD